LTRLPTPMENDLQPSKTQRKKEVHALQDLGEALVALDADKVAELDLPARLHDAVLEAKRISKFGALRRQMQYIGRLMREEGDAAAIRSRLEIWNGTSVEETARLHLLERWRTRLLADDAALADLLEAHPGADAQRLRALIRNARREAEAGKPPKSFREVFQALREIFQTEDR
jgi:ribosome-associated protein